MARPAERIFGEESADEAHARFTAALDDVLAAHPWETVAVVTHGTVLALWVARRAQRDAFALWSSLAMPAFVVLTRPDFAIEHIEGSVL
jgi:broad specificity phosphatase PhoE